MDGLAHSHIFKQKLLNCEPIHLSRFDVDPRTRHLQYWEPFSNTHPGERNSKRLTYHQCCAPPTKRALASSQPFLVEAFFFPATCNLLLQDVSTPRCFYSETRGIALSSGTQRSEFMS
eukprot:1136500-Pelagomonas_calceolata.AAC.1